MKITYANKQNLQEKKKFKNKRVLAVVIFIQFVVSITQAIILSILLITFLC